MSPPEAPAVVAAARTAIGTVGGALAHVAVADLAAPVLARLNRHLGAEAGADASAGLRPGSHALEVVLGNCMGPGGNPARVAALEAGLPVTVTAQTIDLQCASGLAAVAAAGSALRGRPGTILAGGAESASTAPWRCWPPTADRGPERFERAPFSPARIGDPDMGLANDLLAAETGVGRSEQDAYASRSHARAHATREAGGFDAEVVPVAGVHRDQRPRAGMTVERLARLRPVFRPEGTVTAGNSCGVNDGAAAVRVVDAETHRRLGVPGLRLLAAATCGVHPTRPGRAVVPAAQTALERAGLTLDALDVVELTEAFAGQILACCSELNLEPERVCPEGGALGLGHPWGASGAVLVVRLFSQLLRPGGGRYGLAAVAAGGGQGVAVVVEAVR